MYEAFVHVVKCLGYAAVYWTAAVILTALTYRFFKPFLEWVERENTKEKSPVVAANRAQGKNQRSHYSK